MTEMVIRFSYDIEGVVLTEVHHSMKHFFMLIGMIIKLFPWSPLLHYSEKFDFVVGG